MTELNELIDAGTKLVCEKIGIPSKNIKKKSKPGWESCWKRRKKLYKKKGQKDKIIEMW